MKQIICVVLVVALFGGAIFADQSPWKNKTAQEIAQLLELTRLQGAPFVACRLVVR